MVLLFPSVGSTVPSTDAPFEERFHQASGDMRRGRPVIVVDDLDRENGETTSRALRESTIWLSSASPELVDYCRDESTGRRPKMQAVPMSR